MTLADALVPVMAVQRWRICRVADRPVMASVALVVPVGLSVQSRNQLAPSLLPSTSTVALTAPVPVRVALCVHVVEFLSYGRTDNAFVPVAADASVFESSSMFGFLDVHPPNAKQA